MNLHDYQTIIEKTAIYPKEVGPAYCALGLTGEAGEVAEKIKKLHRDNPEYLKYLGKAQNGFKPFEVEEVEERIAKELGDVIWYVTAMANEIGYSLADIMEMNYTKLIRRRETGTLHGSGDNREER